jgi:hypothetical protein
MEITIKMLSGFECKAGMTNLPILVSIESIVPIEVAEKIDINSAALIKPSDPNFFMGFSKSITSILRGSMVIDQTHPYCTQVNVFEDADDDEYGNLIPGKYELRVDATVFRKNSIGYSAEVLSKSMPLEIGI